MRIYVGERERERTKDDQREGKAERVPQRTAD